VIVVALNIFLLGRSEHNAGLLANQAHAGTVELNGYAALSIYLPGKGGLHL
jgi:hypothetical protein